MWRQAAFLSVGWAMNRVNQPCEHRLIADRSSAMDQAIAQLLRHDPALLELSRGNLERWSKACFPRGRSTLKGWRVVLDGSLQGIIDLLTGEDK
jgi:hypothetical protein